MQMLNLAHLEESDIKYTITTFPDGEPHITINSIIGKEEIKVCTRICNPTDLMILLEINDILTRYEIEWVLEITYLMSARMDRVMSLNRPYTLKIIANILSSLSCKWLYVLDTHNHNKLARLIETAVRVESNIAYKEGYVDPSFDVIIFPDKGSLTRWGRYNISKDNRIVFDKIRNLETGEILNFEIIECTEHTDVNNFTFVDDLCDGGGTFLGELSILKEKFPNKTYSIYITHCVNEIGLRRLLGSFDKVYTTNSYKDWDLIFPEHVESGRLVVNKVI